MFLTTTILRSGQWKPHHTGPQTARRGLATWWAGARGGVVVSTVVAAVAMVVGGVGRAGAERWEGEAYALSGDAVTGEALGGEPVVLRHEGREFRFADQGNAERFLADPEAFVSAVDERMVADQLPYYPLEVCPVSGDELGGAMGEPTEVVHRNRLVRLCCDACVGEFRDDAAAVVGRLDEAVKQRQDAEYPLEVCPVSGQRLGSMGEPVVRVLAGRLVKLCCGGCVGALERRPAEVLQAVDEAWQDAGVDPATGEAGAVGEAVGGGVGGEGVGP